MYSILSQLTLQARVIRRTLRKKSTAMCWSLGKETFTKSSLILLDAQKLELFLFIFVGIFKYNLVQGRRERKFGGRGLITVSQRLQLRCFKGKVLHNVDWGSSKKKGNASVAHS